MDDDDDDDDEPAARPAPKDSEMGNLGLSEKSIPSAIYGGLAKGDDDEPQGALARFKKGN